MSTSPFTRYVCWDKQPLNKVINTEAVSIDRAIFLATHTPFNNITYLKSPRQIKDTSETQLLEELLHRSDNDEHTFVVMQGIQGTGKSHLIRWLKERYAAESQERHLNDVVLLIERANSSLRQTLSQIVRSRLFDAERFANQIKKLESATQQLSDESLSDTILHYLEVATREVDVPAPRRIAGKVGEFLRNGFIRQHLKQKGAAIERVRLFLSGKGDTIGLSEHEFPKFNATDFDFPPDVKRKILIEGGHRDARDLAETLSLKPGKQQELADYLNQLLPFAIERTTALSANDLKQMFYDLRRELKQQGKNLVLFIEDISVFTGLDAGLVDVLVTQHTGEGGRDYCRLTSVVGITDAYFKDSFPGNIKDRVTHHLTLNIGDGEKESLLLKSQEAVADIASRYLNALRLYPHQIEEWVKLGARPSELPNACQSCAHRPICHAAFGARPLSSVHDEGSEAGLYPFNKQSLWTLYQRLDTTKVAKTPRTFLGSILEYILQSHGAKVKEGQFPPPARELSNAVRPPTLTQDAQRRMITRQTPSTAVADRIESLILFWGDRTINRSAESGETAVGNLSEPVFRAFDLPFIEGDVIANPPHRFPTPIQPKTVSTPTVQIGAIHPATVTSVEPKPIAIEQSPVDPIIQDIQEWRRGSELVRYSDLSKWLANFVKEFIDWEAHNVSPTLVDTKVTGGRFVIEGQKGRAQGDYLVFKRSDDLAFVLQALTDLNQRANVLSATEIGGHLITLSNWMEKEEARIVEFVQRPLANLESPRSLLELLVHTNLFISCLGEEFATSKDSPRDLYLRLMKSSARRNSWQTVMNKSPYPRSKEWRDLMRGLQTVEADCRGQLEILVNRPQGGSRYITFIDAASVLDIISDIKKEGWDIPQLDLQEVAKVNNKVWQPVATAYNKLQSSFAPTALAETQHIQTVSGKLLDFLAGATPADVFQAIENLFQSFRDNAISISLSRFSVNEALTPGKLTNRLKSLQAILDSENIEALILSLSGAGELLQESAAYVDYFERFVKVAREEETKLGGHVASLERESQGDDLYQQMLDQYDKLNQLLTSTTQTEGETRP
ncbi:MAG: ATP-binding protein [Chloroflexi bacterium]|nr:ATP-binding protein [Chloroflexota bacterium]